MMLEKLRTAMEDSGDTHSRCSGNVVCSAFPAAPVHE